MKRRLLALGLCAAMALSLGACGEETSESVDPTDYVESDDLDYEYGEDVTFYSEEPVNYSMLFSDHENYPYQEDWLLWEAIEEKTNVSFDLNIVARTDYDDKVSALVNSGEAPYIIPKIYSDDQYAASGQVVAISDWVQYMPNYQKCIEEWDMEEDLNEIRKVGGKYYKLPGLWEEAAGGYSLIIRKDIFEAAGIDVEEMEKTWTWETFTDALRQVKEYTGADYVWSDEYQLGAAMDISGEVYNVRAGYSNDGGDWGLKDGTWFDYENEEFYFSNTTDEYKDYLKMWNTIYSEGLLDPETLTQETDQAQAKFYRGESYVLTANAQLLQDMKYNDKMQVDDAELYMIVPPGGPAGQVRTEKSRLECGVMISQNALDELGTEEFIKMLRFVDWLWYSDEGQTLSLWGVEGETYTKDDDGSIVLNSDIYYNGINPDATKQLNVDFGFASGVFAYGGSTELRYSKMTEEEIDYNERVSEYKEDAELDLWVMADDLDREDLNLIKTPLMDYVNTAALEFITGKRDIDADWDTYVEESETKGSTKYIDMANELFNESKDDLVFN